MHQYSNIWKDSTIIMRGRLFRYNVHISSERVKINTVSKLSIWFQVARIFTYVVIA